ncbi:hypothetical protein E2C01_095435 [Portunus trituberculatus]|uniref:Uncharacterized protein n=1 Tax=Portunus trituberculatus TaxID=210409 RepID=A0A5B7K477_PORTR|nr:hypothetical protein [Portunus trituberculatus]
MATRRQQRSCAASLTGVPSVYSTCHSPSHQVRPPRNHRLAAPLRPHVLSRTQTTKTNHPVQECCEKI